jgi:DNA-binding response OmpR family regulator
VSWPVPRPGETLYPQTLYWQLIDLIMAGIVIVDDEAALRGMIRDYFELAGYRVREAADGRDLRRLIETEGYEPGAEIVLLDVALPGESGFELARFLRERHDGLGIIMLTGAASVVDRVVGLEGGADDYVTKPFDLRELMMRVNAVLRRRAARSDARAGSPARFGPYRLDLAQFRLFTDAGHPVDLLPTEVDLVVAFSTNPDKVLSREQLLRLAPARGDDALDRSIDSRITRLRRKLERDPQNPILIQTVRGTGYIHPTVS